MITNLSIFGTLTTNSGDNSCRFIVTNERTSATSAVMTSDSGFYSLNTMVLYPMMFSQDDIITINFFDATNTPMHEATIYHIVDGQSALNLPISLSVPLNKLGVVSVLLNGNLITITSLLGLGEELILDVCRVTSSERLYERIKINTKDFKFKINNGTYLFKYYVVNAHVVTFKGETRIVVSSLTSNVGNNIIQRYDWE